MYVPGRGLLGSIAPSFCKPGRLAVITRSGTLTLAMARQLTLAGIGQSLVAHIGGDTVVGRNPHEYLAALAHDRERQTAVLYCGEIGGDKEYAFAETMRDFPKPVVAMVVGRHAPAGKAHGPCRRARRQRARRRGREACGAGRGGMPGGHRAGAGGRDAGRTWIENLTCVALNRYRAWDESSCNGLLSLHRASPPMMADLPSTCASGPILTFASVSAGSFCEC